MDCLGVAAGTMAASRGWAAAGVAFGAGLGWLDVVGGLSAGAGDPVEVSGLPDASAGTIPPPSCGIAVSASGGLATAADTAAAWAGVSGADAGFVPDAGSLSDTELAS